MSASASASFDVPLSWPFFMYPKFPFHGYDDKETYIPELYRLYNFLDTLDKKIILHLTIGAPMVELYRIDKSININYHLHQLFPAHLIQSAKKEINVINIIVSPNTIDEIVFKDFTKINDNEFVHKIFLNYKVYVFNTMMPTNDQQRNEHYMKYYIKKKFQEQSGINMEEFRQTQSDNDFTTNFYRKLKLLNEKIVENKGAVSCFNFAVFNEDSPNAVFNQFTMFPEIKDCFSNEKNILLEWKFEMKNYYMYDEKKNKISYVPINKLLFENKNLYNENIMLICIKIDPIKGYVFSYEYIYDIQDESLFY